MAAALLSGILCPPLFIPGNYWKLNFSLKARFYGGECSLLSQQIKYSKLIIKVQKLLHWEKLCPSMKCNKVIFCIKNLTFYNFMNIKRKIFSQNGCRNWHLFLMIFNFFTAARFNVEQIVSEYGHSSFVGTLNGCIEPGDWDDAQSPIKATIDKQRKWM